MKIQIKGKAAVKPEPVVSLHLHEYGEHEVELRVEVAGDGEQRDWILGNFVTGIDGKLIFRRAARINDVEIRVDSEGRIAVV